MRSTVLTTLEVRRQRGDLIECYKILTGKENIDPHQFFHLSITHMVFADTVSSYPSTDPVSTSGKNFFSQRVISSWNSLPQHVADATSVNTFKNRLDAHWKPSDIDNKGSAY